MNSINFLVVFRWENLFVFFCVFLFCHEKKGKIHTFHTPVETRLIPESLDTFVKMADRSYSSHNTHIHIYMRVVAFNTRRAYEVACVCERASISIPCNSVDVRNDSTRFGCVCIRYTGLRSLEKRRRTHRDVQNEHSALVVCIAILSLPLFLYEIFISYSVIDICLAPTAKSG